MKTEDWGNGARSKFRGSPLQKFFLSCPRTRFYCAAGMLTPPPKTDAGFSNEPGGLEVGVECGWCGWTEGGLMRWGKGADRSRRSPRKTHAGVVLGGLAKRHFGIRKHRKTWVDFLVSVVSCVVSFTIRPQRNPCKY